MCLESIADLLANIDDLLVSDLDDRSRRLEEAIALQDRHLLDELEELHRARARELSRLALVAGVAMGRGLAHFYAQAESGNHPWHPSQGKS